MIYSIQNVRVTQRKKNYERFGQMAETRITGGRTVSGRQTLPDYPQGLSTQAGSLISNKVCSPFPKPSG